MTDVLLVGTIVAFFALAALLVRGLGRLIADAASDAESASDAEAYVSAEGETAMLTESGR